MFDGYKTVVFFVVALAVAVANFFGFGDFAMTADQLELFNIILAVIGLVLRFITKTPVFKSDAKG